jgi:hypothetical protein
MAIGVLARRARFAGLEQFLADQRRRIAAVQGHGTKRIARARDDRWHLESRGVETKHFDLDRAPVAEGTTLPASEE